MLGRVTYNRHDNHANKHLGHTNGVPDVFDCADEKLREESDHRCGDNQDDDGLPGRPMHAAFLDSFLTALEEIFMSPERETKHAEVGKEQDDSDAYGELLLNQRAPARGGRGSREVEA